MTNYQIRKRHKWHCFYKVKHETEVMAQEAMHSLIDAGTYLAEELEIYVCFHCGWLHIGHSPRWRYNGKDETKRLGAIRAETGGTRGQELRLAKEARDRAVNAVDAQRVRGAGVPGVTHST